MKINFNETRSQLKALASYSKNYKKQILFITFVRILTSIITIGIAISVKYTVDAAVGKDLDTAIKFGSIVIFIMLFQLIISRLFTIYSVKVRAEFHNEIQLKILNNYLNKPYLEINHYKTGDLMTRATNDVSKIVDIWLSSIPGLISLIIQLITAYIILSQYNQSIAVLAFLVAPVTIVFSWFIGHRMKQMQLMIQEAISELRSYVNETLQNIEIIKTYSIKDRTIDNIEELQIYKRKLSIKKAIYKSLSKGIIEFGFLIGYLGATILGAYKLYIGEISFGTFTAFAQLVALIQGPIYSLTSTLPTFITVLSSVERLFPFKETVKRDRLSIDETEFDGLRFENVTFGYNKEKVLENLNVEIKKGDKIAVVGPSGIGKTTFIRLMLGLIKPDQGQILVHTSTKDVHLHTEFNNIFSYVPQKNTLFSGTIISNLRLANETLNENEIIKALKASEIYDHIKNLEDGLQTYVGERLEGLSEGQAQRICIARALIHPSSLMILDEATSALDYETEKKIIKNITLDYPDKTIVTITHRDTILDICNRIIKIKDKKIEG